MADQGHIRWFSDIRLRDVPSVGGKTASLGELYSVLSQHGVRVPDGFALTAQAYREALTAAGAWDRLHALLDGLDKRQVDVLAQRAAEARKIVYEATASPDLHRQTAEAYRQLEAKYGAGVAAAVRSSATAEDLPTASFAGQHDSFLNVRGAEAVFEACRRCFASIFTDRAISYRIDNGFGHFKVALSVAVMKMVKADAAASGVAFTLDTESAGCLLKISKPRAFTPCRNASAVRCVRFHTVSRPSSFTMRKLTRSASISVFAGVNGVSPSAMLLRYFLRSR